MAAVLLKPEAELVLALRGSPEHQPDQPSIIMLGDSHTEFVNWPLLLHCPSIANHGIGGNDTSQILARVPEIIAKKPRLVVLMAGTNDARRYVPPTQTRANLASIRASIEAAGIEFISLTPPPLPSRGDSVNVSISAATLAVPFTLDDLRPDQIHLRRSGYAKWRDAIAPTVQKYC